MDKLITELQRLYFLKDQHWFSQKLDDSGEPIYAGEGAVTSAIVTKSLAGESNVGLDLVSSDGMARAMVVSFERATDWAQVAKLYQAVQDELDLPAPAIAVSGHKGYRLWFSLAKPAPVAQVRDFLKALRSKYLADIPVTNLAFHPDSDNAPFSASTAIRLAPALHLATGKWSAFIDPSLGAMFVDEPGLEMAPNMDRQASILAGLKSIKAADFARALGILQAPPEADSGPGLAPVEPAVNLQGDADSQPGLEPHRSGSKLNVGNNYRDPASFLLAVMNDSSASARQRIKAAKALLPYFARATPE